MAWLGVCVFVMVQLAWLHDPIGEGIDADIISGYTLYSCRACELVPWAIHGCHQSVLAASEGPVFVPYLNHPPLGPLLMQFVHGPGDGLFPLRVASLGLSLFLLVAFALLLRNTAPQFTAVAVALLASAGALVAHGSGASPPLYGMALSVLAMACWLRRDGPSWLYGVVALLAAFTDWNGYGAVPALWMAIYWSDQWRGRRVRGMLHVVVPWCLGIVLYVWHVQGAAKEAGGLDAVLMSIQDALGFFGRSLDQLLGMLARNVLTLYDWPLLAVAAVGLLLALRRVSVDAGHSAAKLCILLWVAALVPCLLFLSRSATHPFWVILLAPPLALSAGIALEACLRPLRRGRPLAFAIMVILVGGYGVHAGWQIRERRVTPVQEQRAEVLHKETAPEDVLLFSDYASAFSCRAIVDRCVVVRMESRAMLQRAARALKEHPLKGRILFCIPEQSLGAMTWLMQIPSLVQKQTAVTWAWPGSSPLVIVQLDRDRFRALAE
jgi:hypothetical protein